MSPSAEPQSAVPAPTRRRGHRWTRFLASGAALTLVGLAASGCDVSPSAATVNGTAITQSELNSQLSAIVQSPYARCALELQGSSLPSSLTGAGDNTASAGLASYQLSTMVLDELITQDLARHRHPVTASAVAAAREDLAARLEPSASAGASPCGVGGQQLLARLPAGFAAQQLHFLADQEQLAVALGKVDLSTAALERYYLGHPSEFAQLCISDIAVTSQAQAQAIQSAVASGATSFAAEARQSSIDTETAANGGAIPCVASSDVQNPSILGAIAALGTGQVSQPIPESTPAGGTVWLLIQVNGRPELPFAQAKPQIRQALLSAQDSRLSKEFDRLTATRRVTVDPRYGSWRRLQGVRPPVPPPARFVLSPSANAPPGASSLGG